MSNQPTHFINGNPIEEPFPEGLEQAVFGMGCFWGVERRFWETPGVFATAVGYAGGTVPEASYQQVCSGRTGHAEVVLVIFEAERIGYEALLRLFWENHDPTQGHRQGNDIGTQYRSIIMTMSDAQAEAAEISRDRYKEQLTAAGYGPITTEIVPFEKLWYAEGYHQQYLAKNPGGYCGVGGTGIRCPAGVATTS
ncbi:MAG: peptide-methionine (S)-S-oxide reductase MsrA [Pseudomonadota bacterium]|nr:peptide-methionine (S)-S-oxide reductase MsrA [Pseudomonadota bacterium]